MKQLEKELEEAWDIYVDKVQNIADHYFKEFVEPFCKKRNLRFISGNGSLVIFTRKDEMLDIERYPSEKFQEITEILTTLVDGYGQGLGTTMPSYMP